MRASTNHINRYTFPCKLSNLFGSFGIAQINECPRIQLYASWRHVDADVCTGFAQRHEAQQPHRHVFFISPTACHTSASIHALLLIWAPTFCSCGHIESRNVFLLLTRSLENPTLPKRPNAGFASRGFGGLCSTSYLYNAKACRNTPWQECMDHREHQFLAQAQCIALQQIKENCWPTRNLFPTHLVLCADLGLYHFAIRLVSLAMILVEYPAKTMHLVNSCVAKILAELVNQILRLQAMLA
jgi:hypothetical protein